MATMENLDSERIGEKIRDDETKARLLGALGLYSCENDIYPAVEHTDSLWIVRSGN